MKKIILFSIIFLLSASQVFSQPKRIKFSHISLLDGLSQSSVTSIIQDDKGFMWFATIDGLNKYDGYDIKIYYSLDETGSLPDNVINDLCVVEQGNKSGLWVATAGGGIARYDKVNDLFITYAHNDQDKNSLSNNAVNSLLADGKILWIGTNKGLNKFDTETEKWKHFFKHKDSASILSYKILKITKADDTHLWIGTDKGVCYFDKNTGKSTNINITPDEFRTTALFTDNKNKLWIGTDNGLIFYDPKTKEYKLFTTKDGLSENTITAIVQDNNGIIWIGTQFGGLNAYNPEKNSFYIYKHDPANRNSLSTNSILSLYQDKSNILWVGTSLGGVNKWNRAAEALAVFRHNPYDSYSLSSNQVRSIYEDNSGTIWIGTVDGGLNKWIQKENKFIHYQHDPKNKNSLAHNHVRTMIEDSFGNFWVGTDGGGLDKFLRKKGIFIHYNKNGKNGNISNNRIWKIIEDNGKLWIATYGGGLNLMDIKTGETTVFRHDDKIPGSITSDFVTTVFKDKQNNIWVGTIDGLNKLDKNTGKFTHYVHINGDKTSISNNRIYSIYQDSDGDIWVGTKGGLNKYLPQTEAFERYTVKTHDFPNNVMMGIIEDSNGFLWITTNRGLSKFDKKTGKIRNYDVRDGLQSNEFLVGSFFKTKNGEIIVGGINGFNAFYPEKIKDNPNKPVMVITAFQVSNEIMELDSAISEKHVIHLNHTQTDISFHFVALDYIFPEKNQYAYKLEGYDEDWVYVKYDRTAKYTNLPPKKYIFKVKGSNNDEVWNEEGTEIVVIIHPAIYQTLWFKIAVGILIIALAAFGVWLRIRILQRQKEYLEEQVRLRTAQIQQQKEEIEAQRDEIMAQRDILAEQKKEITDSIKYAKRIQTAVLPQKKYLDKILDEYFVLYMPRDIVSGDFYWAEKAGDKIIITAADCTGHGVPGAFMSMLGISFLNEIVNLKQITEPDKILNTLRDNVIEALHQTGEEMEAKDGMDITLCTIDTKKQKLCMAGANNPLYLVRNGEIQIFDPDSMPIAIYDIMKPFAKHEINIQKGDIIYMFSDGFADQFGGPKGKKFMYKRFRKLLVSIADKKLEEQKQILQKTITDWMNHPSPYGETKHAQIDDIVIIGVKL